MTLCTRILREGGCILYPTDTIWGLGCDATDPEAVARVYRIKRRPDRKSMLVLADSPDMIARHVEQIPESVLHLLTGETRPTTIIYPDARNLPSVLLPEEGTIGIRLVRDPFCVALIRALGRPLVSTSANFAGEPSPARYRDISEHLKREVDHVCRWRQGEETPAHPSRILKVEADGHIVVLRE
ncbi:MAG: L-threonylcarbamoyladenylate synthase [Bacteroidales bacterium]